MAQGRRREHGRVTNEGFARLLETCEGLRFEPHAISHELDTRGHHEVPLTREFPLLVKLFHYSSEGHTPGAAWHERLELFVPLDGEVRFRMGSRQEVLAPGDMLVVDNMKLHHVVDFGGFDTRVIVTSFLSEMVYSLGSPSHDYAFLLPFFARIEDRPRILRVNEEASAPACKALARLVECYWGTEDGFREAGSKAFLLELLYHLAQHFRGSGLVPWQMARQQERSARFKPLLEYIRDHYEERLSVRSAARRAGMSESQFQRAFKKVAGMTLVTYVNHVRLSTAVTLLRETDLNIAQIASEVGFADQSYFDRCFRRHFGVTPREYRRRV